MRASPAFTVIEILTALVLLAVGLAGFTRAAGAIAMLQRDARLRRTVADAMQARLDSLAAAPCLDADGRAERDGVIEQWRAVVDGRAISLTDTLIVPARPQLGRTLQARVRCAP